MTLQINKVAVLGGGVMGSGIAAHLANAGIPSLMFDLEKPVASVKALLKAKPAPLFSAAGAQLITPCSYTDDSERMAECDWVVEVVTERLDIKLKVFESVRKYARPDAIITSNTSGIPIASMVEGAPEDFKKRFFVTHFFNPVRYMKLLELVDGPDTDPELYQAFARWGETTLGKGIVYAKDTVNFVANRIGTYGMLAILHRMTGSEFTITQIDKIFGKPTARPNSAIFRTADMVGLDTLAHVADNCYQNLPDDPFRDTFLLPEWIKEMLDKGLLGDKTKQGFYKKSKDADGKRVILAIDQNTLEYAPKEKVRFPSLGAIRDIDDWAARYRKLLSFDDPAATLAWEATADLLVYSALLLGEIADDVVNIDNAMKWGYGWTAGPFETWDAIGLAESVERMKAEGRELPPCVAEAVEAGGWYARAEGTTSFLDVMGDKGRKPVPVPPGVLLLADRKEQGNVVAKNMGATIIDLGDGVAGLEFHTKMNSIDADIVTMYNTALDRLDSDFDALVVGNQADHFSAGANIFMVMGAAMQKDWDQLDTMIRGLQDTVMRAKYHTKPVVTAPRGMALGGGCEMTMHSAATVAAGELYAGLVEVGVGLLPAGGGCKELIWRTVGAIPEGVDVDPFPFVVKAFQQIGMGKVATSAEEARAFGYLRPSDLITMNADKVIADAKALARGLANAGYRPPKQRTVRLPGPDGAAALDAGIYQMVLAGWISEFDALIGRKVSHVLCGGNTSPKVQVTEQQLLDLEREAFLSLCGEAKTIERIQHMLMKGKPLRN